MSIGVLPDAVVGTAIRAVPAFRRPDARAIGDERRMNRHLNGGSRHIVYDIAVASSAASDKGADTLSRSASLQEETSMMIKASIAAMAATMALALAFPATTTTSYAMAAFCRPAPCPPTTSSEEPGGPGGPGGNGGDIPPPPPDQQLAKMEDTCNGALQQLVKIPEKMVVAFADENGVTVVPVCNSGLAKSAKLDASQALPLQNAIAANPALMRPLTAHGFHAEDVVGVVLIKGVATLYVHHAI
jgi:hypothetical protein